MTNQSGNFTTAMRKATDPHHPAGGSELVRGQSITKTPTQATAYMLVTADHVDPDSQESSTEESPERNVAEELAASDHSVSPPPSPRNDEQSSSVQDDISYDHHAAHIAAITTAQPSPRMSFFDKEYVQ
jgi:hypothetical protein